VNGVEGDKKVGGRLKVETGKDSGYNPRGEITRGTVVGGDRSWLEGA